MTEETSQAEPRLPVNASETSKLYIAGLAAVAEEIRNTTPEFVGMTCFGSVARGEARAPGDRGSGDSGSDVDAFLYFLPDPNSYVQGVIWQNIPPDRRIGISTKGEASGSAIFADGIMIQYRHMAREIAERHGLPPNSDLEPLPISEEIVIEQVNRLLVTAKIFESGEAPDILPSRTLQGLFQAPVIDSGLVEFRKQTLSLLAQSPYGERAWRALRGRVGKFEVGIDGNPVEINHRYVPSTVAEAVAYYGASSS